MRPYDYETLLTDYAAGALDEALTLLMASHLCLDAHARAHVALCESLGGALIGECRDEAIPMRGGSLAAVLNRLDAPRPSARPCVPACAPCGATLPGPLGRYIAVRGAVPARWWPVWPGISIAPLPAPAGWRATLIRLRGGARKRCRNSDIILVIQGVISENGSQIGPGALLIPARNTLIAAESACLLLVLSGRA